MQFKLFLIFASISIVYSYPNSNTISKPPSSSTHTTTTSSIPSTSKTSPASGSVLHSGSGKASYYYDVAGATCLASEAAGYAETSGYTACEPNDVSLAKTLKQHGTNYIVAIDDGLLSSDKAKYCGKRIKVTKGGEEVAGTFYVWDGCAACAGGARLDLSVTAINQADPNACTLGLIDISWEILNEQVVPYVN